MQRTILGNARIVLADDIVEGSLVIEDDVIVGIEAPACRPTRIWAATI